MLPTTERQQSWRSRLPLGHRVEDWLDVEDRGAVERFEVADLDSQAGGIVSGDGAQLVAAGAVKPADHDDVLAGAQITDRFGHAGFEFEPGGRVPLASPFVTGPFVLAWAVFATPRRSPIRPATVRMHDGRRGGVRLRSPRLVVFGGCQALVRGSEPAGSRRLASRTNSASNSETQARNAS